MKKQDIVKKLVSSGLSTLFAATALFAASYAWLSSNRKVDSNGLQMQIDTTPNLVIATDKNLFGTDSYLTNSVYFTSDVSTFAPCTHDGGMATGLKYVTNPNEISISTGLQSGSTALTYANAANVQDGTQYYVEQTVYIASNAKALPNVNLKASIASATKASDEITSGSLMASSVDFYVGGTFKGTLNVANKSNTVTVSSGTIPLMNSTDGFIAVTMRFYFDGALVGGDSKAYINTETLDTSAATLNITFVAEDIVS